MKRPTNVPEDIWSKACLIISFGYDDLHLQGLTRVDVAYAILEERNRRGGPDLNIRAAPECG